MRIIARALDADVPAGWVTGDEVYGQQARLRMMLEERQMPYVLAVPVNQRLIATVDDKVTELRADALAARLPGQAWKRSQPAPDPRDPRQFNGPRQRSGPRTPAATGCWAAQPGRSTDLAYYLCHGPEPHPAG